MGCVGGCRGLEREFEANIILTNPTVEYKEETEHGKKVYSEPIATVDIVTPQEFVGAVMRLAEDSRGTFIHMDNKSQVYLSYEIPLAELMGSFFDKLKTVTSGYASLQWEFKEFRRADADRLTILLNLDPVEEFSEYVVAEKAFERASDVTSKLKDLIPRQQYEVRIQALYKGKIIASSRVSPFRKDVTQKLYGGDRTRKDKLLKKQKEGKKLMKNIGSVEIPKEVFLKLFQNK
jgi:GTP-binding protein LepA